MKQSINIVWYKRDLRIFDHGPLFSSSMQKLPVLPIYIVEEEYWKQKFSSRRHWHFVHDCLFELQNDLKSLGQPLIVRVGSAIDIFDELKKRFEINTVFTHEESGNNWTYQRDIAISHWCKNNKIHLENFFCNGVVRRLKSRDDWSKIRNRRMSQKTYPKPIGLKVLLEMDPGRLPEKNDPMFGDDVPGSTQRGGRTEGNNLLKTFLYSRGSKYLNNISSPGGAENFCSRLSPHLTWGTISVREVIKECEIRCQSLTPNEATIFNRAFLAFKSRLSWRCHFIQKIEDKPEIEFKCMHNDFEDMRGGSRLDERYFLLWSTGYTGYPLIDACMRSLINTGWLTFRMRAMLVSFASYHLWLDWRKTGLFLAQTFTDYEPGIHYSQLQMQSGVTGINTVRIYNPVKQSKEHDSEGRFIRKWVPELFSISNIWIHEPWLMTDPQQVSANCIIGKDYPGPIVNHENAVKNARQKIRFRQKRKGFNLKAEEIFQKLGSRNHISRRKVKKRRDKNQLTMEL